MLLCSLKNWMSPFVEGSCEETASEPTNSGWMALASCLPSSTPHWS